MQIVSSTSPQEGRFATDARPPIDVNLRIVSLKGSIADLLFEATPRASLKSLTIGLLLPRSVALLTGNMSIPWVGSPPQDSVVTIPFSVNFTEDGNWAIGAYARSDTGFQAGTQINLQSHGNELSTTKTNAAVLVTDTQTSSAIAVRNSSIPTNLQSPGLVTLALTVQTQLRDTAQTTNLRLISIEVWKRGCLGLCDSNVASGVTDLSGQFVAVVDVGSGGDDFYWKLWANDGVAANVMSPDWPYSTYSAQTGLVHVSSSAGYVLTLTGDNRGGWYIHEQAVIGYLYAQSLGHTHNKVNFYWKPTYQPNSPDWTSATALSGYSIYIASEDSGNGDEWAPSVILHEYGHSVLYQVYGNRWVCTSCGGRHYWGQTTDPNFAWSEGWPSYFGQTALNGPIYDTSANIYNSIYWDLRWTPTNNDGHPYAGSDASEVAVANALWALYDSSRGRSLSLGAGYSWNVFAYYNPGTWNYHVDSILDFYNGWRYYGYTSQIDGPFIDQGVLFVTTQYMTITQTSTSYSYRTTTTTSTSYTSTTTSTNTIPTVTTVVLVPLTITSTDQSTQSLTSVVTTTVTSYTSTTTSTSTIPTTVALVPLTVTSIVQSIQYLTSILSTTVTNYISTQTSTSTVVVPTTVVLVPLSATSTVESTEFLTSTATTTVTSYTSTVTLTSTVPTVTTVVLLSSTTTSTVQNTQFLTSILTTTTTSYTTTVTSTSTSVVYTTVTVSLGAASGAGSIPLTYFSFLSLLAITVGHKVVASRPKKIPKVRSAILPPQVTSEENSN